MPWSAKSTRRRPWNSSNGGRGGVRSQACMAFLPASVIEYRVRLRCPALTRSASA